MGAAALRPCMTLFQLLAEPYARSYARCSKQHSARGMREASKLVAPIKYHVSLINQTDIVE